MNCPNCGKKLEYSGPVEGEGDWVYRSYKCPNCGRDALGSAWAKRLNKAVGWYGGRAGVVPGKAEDKMPETYKMPDSGQIVMIGGYPYELFFEQTMVENSINIRIGSRPLEKIEGGMEIGPRKAEEARSEKTQGALEYLAWWGRDLYPYWEWAVVESDYRRSRECYVLKVRQ